MTRASSLLVHGTLFRTVCRLLAVLLVVCPPVVLGSAAATARTTIEQPLVADLSEHLVAITTGFTGADVLLFGATDGPGDVVIVVRGPSQDTVVRAKARFGPIWANAEAMTFADTPSFYRVAASRPLEDIAAVRDLARLGIGTDNLALIPVDLPTQAGQEHDFRTALIDLRDRKGFYDRDVADISQMANRLFRTRLHFPANVPVGVYQVTVYLFRDGNLTSAEIVPLVISKTGIGAEIYDFAYNHSALYGLFAILVAVFAGWLASVAFRR